jgi:hypothetical protein
VEKSELLKVRIEPTQLETVQKFAETCGVTVSEVVRLALKACIERTEDGGIAWAGSNKGPVQRFEEHWTQRQALAELRQTLVDALNKTLALEAAADRGALAS